MPLFLSALLGGLVQVAGSIAGRVLLSLGFGFISYTAMDSTMEWMREQVFAQLSGLPASTIGVLAVMKIDVAINIIVSAILVRLLLDGLTGGAIKRLVAK